MLNIYIVHKYIISSQIIQSSFEECCMPERLFDFIFPIRNNINSNHHCSRDRHVNNNTNKERELPDVATT